MGGPNLIQQLQADKMNPLIQFLENIDCPVIVEGKSDMEALKRFEVENIYPLNGRPLFKVALRISEKHDNVLVLTDFDKEGRKLAKKLNSFLTSFGATPKNKLRGKIKRIITKKGISAIEELKPENLL